MPDLGVTLFNSETLTLTRCPNSFKSFADSSTSSDSLYPCPIKTPAFDNDWPCDFDLRPELPINGEFAEISGRRSGLLKIRVTRMNSSAIDGEKKVLGAKCLEDYVRDWKARKIASGLSENRCFLPFLVGSPGLAECRVCSSYIYPGDEVSCSVRGCKGIYHLKCAKDSFQCSFPKKFKCPQHACFICKQKFFWRCVRCEVASHDKCAAWPEKVIRVSERPGWAVCWRHPKDWRQKHGAVAYNFEDIFSRLPLPYTEEEFNIESTLKDGPNEKMEPPPYVHIRRNVYLVKKKRDDAGMDIGCTSCRTTCSEDCVCRVQSISCSKACHCSEACTNKPFRKEKKIKIVKTELCGWGVEAAESINKGDFIIEYVGEVIDDLVCTQRLWDMKNKEVKNFYMCEIRKDFTIDATFKGNASRFLNHSCDPNCKLEKWQVEGDIRVGVFAARAIKAGEPLTYDYRFVQFGPEVKCNCGAINCQGYLGAKRKINLDTLNSRKRMHVASLCWGSKQKRSMKLYLTRVQKQ
ncbi:histone-lysine N-methyltransferase ASHR3 [Beta vulgaris subsp. vulgaris]|uniref:histone-lysine N-methyltransferase ASHR3 n=1 Tax=Beta vulgaris subsp. vulgaris TaxID=3555 RepID=UPI002036E7CF|nr:histone-lysine N-methyltransferase ASHR3 [Beta vulgaris subsp. vulgaris]